MRSDHVFYHVIGIYCQMIVYFGQMMDDLCFMDIASRPFILYASVCESTMTWS